MVVTYVRYSQELQEAVAQREGLGMYDAAVREAVSVLTGRFTEVRLFPAWAASEEGVELSPDGATLSLKILPVRFADPLGLTRFLRHELGHVADILDDTFEYGAVPDDLVVTQALRRRFKLLWACSIDGRTARSGGSPLHAREEYKAELALRFPGLAGGVAAPAVDRLWKEERPPYCCLMRMAADLAAHPAAAEQGVRYTASLDAR